VQNYFVLFPYELQHCTAPLLATCWCFTYQLKCNSTRRVTEMVYFFRRLRKSYIALLLGEELPSV